jgi:glycosyltransferase involved in cell wall biosynthesis
MGQLESQKMKKPLVSVVMTAYNAQEFLNIAIDSILLQTYKNFEFIIIDDGSTDHSGSIIKAYEDKRIKYIHQKNQGQASALNKGIGIARGEYIARMDADDISYPTRLERQVDFLEAKKNIAMVGAGHDFIDEDSGIFAQAYYLTRSQDIKMEFLVRNPFAHATVMIRREVLNSVGGYDPNQPIEDYELWWRVARKYEVANMPEMLLGYRVVPTGISHSGSNQRQQPITKMMSQIWGQSKTPKLTTTEFIEALNHYMDLGAPYREQYLYMVCALTTGLYKMGYYKQALDNLTKLLRVRGSVKAFKEFRKHPFTHNYNVGILKTFPNK